MNTISLTKNNFFQFGYDRKNFCARPNLSSAFWVSYQSCNREPLDWRAECVIAAREIYEMQGDRIRVCMSGGIDSEIVAESFRLARIPFTAAILRFKGDTNFHDISWALAYCQKHNIKYEIYDLDTESFIQSAEFYEIAYRSGCIAPGIVFQLKLAQLLEEKKYYPVIGAGDVYLKKIEDFWFLSHSELYLSLFRYQIAFKATGTFRFFQFSPELVFSFLKAPKVVRLVNNGYPDIKSHDLIKHEIINDFFFVEKRTKYTGTEKLRNAHEITRQKLLQMMPTSYNFYYMNYFHALQSLHPKKKD